MNIQSYDIIRLLQGKKRLSLWERWQRWILGVGLFGCLACPTVNAVEKDKALHASVSVVGTVAIYGLYKAILTRDCRLAVPRPESCPLSPSQRLGAASFAAATMFSIGLLKEMGDRRPDGGDILANGVGAVGAMLPIFVFEF